MPFRRPHPLWEAGRGASFCARARWQRVRENDWNSNNATQQVPIAEEGDLVLAPHEELQGKAGRLPNGRIAPSLRRGFAPRETSRRSHRAPNVSPLKKERRRKLQKTNDG